MKTVFLQGSSMDEFMAELCSRIAEMISANKVENTPLEDGLLTRNEAAEFLSITLPTLSRWTQLKYLKQYNLGSRVYYKKSEILDYLDDNSQLKIV